MATEKLTTKQTLGLHDELKRARSRQRNQAGMLNEAVESFNHCTKEGMTFTANALAAKIKRLRATLQSTDAVVAELEKTTGALPLK